MTLSVIIPAFNEEKYIADTLSEVYALKFPAEIAKAEVIVVDDCSKDHTPYILKDLKTTYPDLIVHRNEKNMGKGASVKKGFELSHGDLIFIQDADSELSPSDIPRMLDALIELKIEFVNGSRYLPGIVRPVISYKRYFANRFFTFLVSFLSNAKLTDIACGHKLIHRNLLEKIPIRSKRFGFEAEVMIKALKIKKNNIAEVPVMYRPRSVREGKKLKSSDGFKILFTILRYEFFWRPS
ncbi:MAG: hypothetical protein A2W93_15750 [Bacteroidetes bacterium GWF2_43_63]|nr:MAG: hypothetical protein A2W94_13640 [Bacteroidetes bacterium GWE2_42_42]OFY53122.1 MAG: hypothetical protein A2W93_15750 [Bacteroidetes bacterium GWF2_43_63]HBG70364.1 hypothetical protein [Bacteroidales bacterium]HCB60589.1 hypothetical protein [Bacteroidales bacterium]HCY22958.1 hypothetical protein [Bacteroidales bacterium]